jgi:hypothetical protein
MHQTKKSSYYKGAQRNTGYILTINDHNKCIDEDDGKREKDWKFHTAARFIKLRFCYRQGLYVNFGK